MAGLDPAGPPPAIHASRFESWHRRESQHRLLELTHMAVTAARVREVALALPGTSEAPHFHRTAFRTKRKIFATLDATVPDLNLLFDPDLRDFYCEQAPHAFAPVPGGWGRKGATRCDLKRVDAATLTSALHAAHALAAPKRG